MDVSDRRLHVQLTQEAKIASDFSLFRAIFAFAGFVSALSLSKSIFDKLADGGVSSPAGCHDSNFQFESWQFRLWRNRRILWSLRLWPPSPIFVRAAAQTQAKTVRRF